MPTSRVQEVQGTTQLKRLGKKTQTEINLLG